ncbi:MAG: hypothetical protein OXC13_12760 [Caldilineaceae bacterium]|nr:hypothetical protein [Caldilineaceae bacterium]
MSDGYVSRKESIEARIPSGVRERFVIMWAGWELDDVGWIANDGRVWMTDHGSGPRLMSERLLRERIAATTTCLEGLGRALESLMAVKEATDEEQG